MKRALLYILVISLSLAGGFSCGRIKKGAALRAVERSDEKIKKDVIDQLYWDSRVDASKIKVSVEDGVVTLEGKVLSPVARQSAGDDAWSIAGVMNVNNMLELTYPNTYLTSVRSDEEIRDDALNALMLNSYIGAERIDVKVDTGILTLEGTVDTLWKQIRAEEIVSEIMGVLEIENKIAVVPSEKISDKRIAQNIIDAIDRNMNVDADNIEVTVENGNVTLTGAVASWDARNAAYESALYTAGVKNVYDKILIR